MAELKNKQILRYYNAKDNKYKELYLSDTRHANIGILNLVSLEERTAEERKEIALKGNEASLKARRINKGIKITKDLARFNKEVEKSLYILRNKRKDNDALSIRDTKHLEALNRKKERKFNKFIEIEEQLRELYGIDLIEKVKERIELEKGVSDMILKHTSKLKGGKR